MTGSGYLRDLGLPCAAFVVLATLNAATIPWFEYPDEKNHIHYAQFIARTGSLPPVVYAPVDDGDATARVAFNPPLYYWIASRIFDPSAPFVSPQVRYAPRGARGFPDAPRCGWSALGDLPTRLAFLRSLSILFGLITVAACWGLGRTVRPAEPALAAAMAWFAVAIPQFVSMSAAINNEGLAVALASLATLLCARSVEGGRASTAGVAGVLLGAAAMAKVSALVLAPALFLAVARGPRGWMRAAALTMATCCVAGPWLFRNWVEHHDPTGVAAIEAVEANRCAGRFPHDPVGILRGAGAAGATFFLWYGQLAVHLPGPLYLVPAALAGLAAWGWRRAAREPAGDVPFGLPAWTAMACLAGAFLAYNLRVYSPQGRYLYVGMVLLAYLAARGLLAWAPIARRGLLVLAVGAVLALAQLGFLIFVVAPAYRA